MATLAYWTPFDLTLHPTQPPELDAVGPAALNRPVLWFDSGAAQADETCYAHFIAPQGINTSTFDMLVYYIAAGTGNTFAPSVAIEAISDADATDLDSASSFATANDGTATTVPATAGYMDVITVDLTTNLDGIAAGDYVTFQVFRDTSRDGLANDVGIIALELRDAQ